MGDCNCGVCCSCIDPVNDYPCWATMIWLWQVFRWSILAIIRHGHTAPHSCCHWDGETRTGDHNWVRSGSLVTLLTKNSHNKLSARLSSPPRVWVTAPGAYPLPHANLRTVAKVCNFLVAGVWANCHWAMLVMLRCFLLASAPPMAAAQGSAVARRCRQMIGV